MASRLFAGLIFAAGAVLLGVVFLGGGEPEAEIETASTAAVGEAVGDAPVSAEPGSDSSAAGDEATTTTEPAIPEPENLGRRLGLENLDGWLNTEISSLDELDGKVVVLELWTFGCFNCQNRIPHTQELYART